jgi:hypothetical protein
VPFRSAVDRLQAVQALPRPRRGEQQLDALRREQLVDLRPGRLGELSGRAVAVGEERDRVDAEQRVFVRRAGENEFARLRLPGLHRALDLVGLVERAVRVQRDLQLAGGRFVDIGSELLHVLGLEAADGVTGGQVPLGLRLRGTGGQADERGQQNRVNGRILHEDSGFRSWRVGG